MNVKDAKLLVTADNSERAQFTSLLATAVQMARAQLEVLKITAHDHHQKRYWLRLCDLGHLTSGRQTDDRRRRINK